MQVKPIIKTKKVGVTYFAGQNNQVNALQDINIEIYPGEFIILFGPSGCGKSTLLYSIAGLQANAHGDIFFYDKNITLFSKKELENYHQRKIGIIFQAFYLINSISAAKNVMLPQIAIGSSDAERKKRTLDLLAHFGVTEQADKSPMELSGGQQQRIAIARALINDPEIILADEPVGNLDTKSAHDVMLLVQELNQKQKKTVILVTHDPSYLDYAHRVFHIKDGRIIKTDINEKAAQIKKEISYSSIPKELELLVRTYSSLQPNQIGGLLIPFKAKQIVSEMLTGMTIEQIREIENLIERNLIREGSDYNALLGLLDREISEGGLGLDKRTASYLAQKLSDIVEEIKLLGMQEECHNSPSILGEEIKNIRNYLFQEFDIKITDLIIIKAIDKIIEKRIGFEEDKKFVQKTLDLTIKQGGAGLDKRTAKKIAQRLELLMLGKYK